MDGRITIGTQIDESKFDKQIASIERKIEAEEKNTQLKFKAKVQAESNLEENIKQINELKSKLDELNQKKQKFNEIQLELFKGKELSETGKSVFQGLYNDIKQIDKVEQAIAKSEKKQNDLRQKVQQTTLAYQKSGDKVKELKSKIDSVNLTKQQEQAKKLQENFNGIGKSVNSSIVSIGKLALGVLSVASAYSLVSSASSTLGQYDKEYASNLEYIRYLLAQALAPALKYLVNLASTLLSYLNYILKARFNITLFSKNSAKNFENAKKSTGGISNNTEKIKKDLQTTSFDEMTVLNDTSSSTGSGGGGADFTAPSINPSLIQGEVPKWLKWIADNKKLILSVFAGVIGGLKAWKLGLDAIKSLGIGLLIEGIVYTIQSLIEYLNDPTWENFGSIIQGIGIALLGLALTIGSVPLAVIGAGVLILGTIIKYWDQIKAFLQEGIDWLTGKSDWVHEMFGDTLGNIYDIFVENLQLILNWFDTTFINIRKIFDELIGFVKNVFTGNWKGAWENIKNIVKAVIDWLIDTFWSVLNIINNVAKIIGTTIGDIIGGALKTVINAFLSLAESLLNKPVDAINSLISKINDVPGIKLSRLDRIELPRMKVGGIINMPGRGIPIGGGRAIGGEAGQEGILPLTDTQAMETLGEAIGRYITINANITNTMNGRVISRQMQQIKNDDNFAYNT